MIARAWRGWTEPEHADEYERWLREVVYPGLRRLAGYRGGYILRQDGMRETGFVTVNLFASLDAITAFAGPDYEAPCSSPRREGSCRASSPLRGTMMFEAYRTA